MDTKPTPTLAKLHVSQSKFDYALAIYLYLQEKKGKDYCEEITQAVKAICDAQWNDYPKQIKKIFTQDEVARFHIIPEELLLATNETLNDIQSDFDTDKSKATEEDIISEESIPETEPELPEEEEALEPEMKIDPEPEHELEKSEEGDDEEEIDFPTLGEGVYQEPEIKVPPAKPVVPRDEDLVPGLADFTSNYKKDVTDGLIEESSNSGDEELDKKLQDDIDQKLINVLRIMRGMSADELRRLLNKKLKEGMKLEELTLGDLEELID